jgi:hypothetical protein
MDLSPPGHRKESLKVALMAVALVVAAFLGAGLGLAWQAWSGGADADDAPPAEVVD